MPTYDYVCDACEHAFEHWQTMTSPIKRTCPECKKRKLRRLIGSGAGVIFKGSGFYETDYKRKSRGKKKPPQEGAPADDGASGSGSNESGATSSAKDSSTKEAKQSDTSKKPGASKKKARKKDG